VAKFEVQGRGRESGRAYRRVHLAFDEQEAREKAASEGTIVESIRQLPEEPASEEQLARVRGLGLSVPEDASAKEVADLILAHLQGDRPAIDAFRAFARHYKVESTRFTGKRALFQRIFTELTQPGREKDLLSWFAYRVYRDLVGHAGDAQIDGPDHPIIQDIAQRLGADDQVIRSLGRYEGQDLIWFGEQTGPNGQQYQGGSNRSLAYSRVAAALQKRIPRLGASAESSARDPAKPRGWPRGEAKDESAATSPDSLLSRVEQALRGMVRPRRSGAG
jgi:hypothetical protein